MKLSEFSIGQPGTISEILDHPLSARLVEFGIFPGASFSVLGRAAFNGPLYLEVGENRIALRLEDAESILVHGGE